MANSWVSPVHRMWRSRTDVRRNLAGRTHENNRSSSSSNTKRQSTKTQQLLGNKSKGGNRDPARAQNMIRTFRREQGQHIGPGSCDNGMQHVQGRPDDATKDGSRHSLVRVGRNRAGVLHELRPTPNSKPDAVEQVRHTRLPNTTKRDCNYVTKVKCGSSHMADGNNMKAPAQANFERERDKPGQVG